MGHAQGRIECQVNEYWNQKLVAVERYINCIEHILNSISFQITTPETKRQIYQCSLGKLGGRIAVTPLAK